MCVLYVAGCVCMYVCIDVNVRRCMCGTYRALPPAAPVVAVAPRFLWLDSTAFQQSVPWTVPTINGCGCKCERRRDCPSQQCGGGARTCRGALCALLTPARVSASSGSPKVSTQSRTRPWKGIGSGESASDDALKDVRGQACAKQHDVGGTSRCFTRRSRSRARSRSWPTKSCTSRERSKRNLVGQSGAEEGGRRVCWGRDRHTRGLCTRTHLAARVLGE